MSIHRSHEYSGPFFSSDGHGFARRFDFVEMMPDLSLLSEAKVKA